MELSRPNSQPLAARRQWELPFVVLAGCFVIANGISVSAITVEEAYKRIPHRYTLFDSTAVKMNSRDAAFLREFFRLVNMAIVARVETQAWFQSSGQKGSTFQDYQRAADGLIGQLESQAVPDGLKLVHRAVIDAIKDQKAYFEDWHRTLEKRIPFKSVPGARPQHPRIVSSSQKLHEAYGILMQAYPQEGELTKQAFFDHLCALDFI